MRLFLILVISAWLAGNHGVQAADKGSGLIDLTAVPIGQIKAQERIVEELPDPCRKRNPSGNQLTELKETMESAIEELPKVCER